MCFWKTFSSIEENFKQNINVSFSKIYTFSNWRELITKFSAKSITQAYESQKSHIVNTERKCFYAYSQASL